MAKVFFVVCEPQTKRAPLRTIGFVHAFGWESPRKKAEAKYPDAGEFKLVEADIKIYKGSKVK